MKDMMGILGGLAEGSADVVSSTVLGSAESIVTESAGGNIANTEESTDALNSEEAAPEATFTGVAQITSSVVDGEGEVAVYKEGLTITTLFTAFFLSWAEVVQLDSSPYDVTIETKTTQYIFKSMGQDTEPFYRAVSAAYNQKVCKALFADGPPLFTTTSGGTPVAVYPQCVLRLPPNMHAQRVPLAFVNSFSEEAQEVVLGVQDGSTYTFARLGSDKGPFTKTIQKAIKTLREKSREAIFELDPSLNAEQTAALTNILPYGTAAPVDILQSIAPGFVAALESRIASSRATHSYEFFKSLDTREAVCIGFKKKEGGGASTAAVEGSAEPGTKQPGIRQATVEQEAAEQEDARQEGVRQEGVSPGGVSPEVVTQEVGTQATAAQATAAQKGFSETQNTSSREPTALHDEPYTIWMIAPAPRKKVCAVEFAGETEEAAATFVYQYEQSWEEFVLELNMALDAIDFKRQIITMSEEDLAKPENIDARMAVERNKNLQRVRNSCIGRVIHSNQSAWQKKIAGLFELNNQSL